MAARCIPTRRGRLQRLVIAAKRLVVECDLICARHALATAEAHGDRPDMLPYWRRHIAMRERELCALEMQ